MKSVTLAVIFAAALAIASCGPSETVPGAWTPVTDTTDEIVFAESVALDAIYEAHPTRAMVASVETEQQVVAGMNYRFHVTMTGSPDFAQKFQVVVHVDLDGEMSVISLDQVQ